MSVQPRPGFQALLLCTTIALSPLSVAVVPAVAGAREGGTVKAAASKTGKKKCKRRRRAGRKCKGRRGGGRAQNPIPPSARLPRNPPESGPSPDQGPTKPDCGPQILKTTGGLWECTFADDFDGTRLNLNKWLPQRTAETGYVSGPDACFVDGPDNVSVSAGTLKLTARKEPTPFSCAGNFTTQYTSGSVTTSQGRFS